MCETGAQLEASWRSTCTQYRQAVGQAWDGHGPMLDPITAEHKTSQYLSALEAYKAHLKSCPTCRKAIQP